MTPIPSTPERGRGEAFTLPCNTEWTMADEWAVTERQCRNMSYRTEPYRAGPVRKQVGRANNFNTKAQAGK